MDAFLTLIDAQLAAFLSPLWRAVAWGLFTGTFSMVIYVLCAPQTKLKQLKAAQKENKKLLKGFDGEFDALKVLIKNDLRYSLHQVAISIVPFLLSVAPAFAIMYGLEAAYIGLALPTLGAEWTGNFEFWYIFAVIVSSLGIKFFFKIT